MNVQECKGCGFKVMTDEAVAEPAADWMCQLCADKVNASSSSNDVPSEGAALPAHLLSPESAPPPPPPKGLVGCPACGGVIKVIEEQFGRRVKCPLCARVLSVSERGEVEEYDEFKEYLRVRARENREAGEAPWRAAVRGRAGGSKEQEEEENEQPPEGVPTTIATYALVLSPFAAGLLSALWPAAVRKIERILAKILPLFG